MNNPITSWIKSGMEPYGARERGMVDRVAETSINAQKLVDERMGPVKASNQWRKTSKSRDFDHFYLGHSAFKGKDEGCSNSFKAVRYYENEGAKYRDELLKEVAQQ
mmetsp:Transcript_5700/g.8488  ORF Transcript_5700/g.8488 Transcript_5700/m.8488 type:complete len:106 (-) Transcript_5700:238-555(-)